jgi:hypothetical protein
MFRGQSIRVDLDAEGIAGQAFGKPLAENAIELKQAERQPGIIHDKGGGL